HFLSPPFHPLNHSKSSSRPRPCCLVRSGSFAGGGWGSARHGEGAVLRQEGAQEGAVDAGGGQAPRRLHPGQRPRQLAPPPQARRAEPVRQELPAAVDELPPAGHQARALHRRGAEVHRPAPRHRRQQVVHDRGAAARPDRQRDQELLEHSPQEAAAPDGPRRSAARAGGGLPGGASHGAVGDRAARGRGAPLPPLLLRRRGDDDDHRRHHHHLRLVVLHHRGA
uniref:Uncharacterized protein n=2 Tax=Oryza TaxID=4527 RepID=I1P2I6_ORYGL